MQESVIVTKQRLVELANAIREKKDINKSLSIIDMISQVKSIGTIPGEISAIILDYVIYFDEVELKNINITL